MANGAYDLVGDTLQKAADEAKAAHDEFEPMIRRLPDLKFAGLYHAVMEERTRRMVRLIRENPVVRQLAVENLVRRTREDNG